MKISAEQVQRVVEIYGKKGVSRVARREERFNDDKVELSIEARQMADLRKRISQLDDVRRDKVNELRAAIKSGAYRPDGEVIAGKMLERMLVDRLI